MMLLSPAAAALAAAVAFGAPARVESVAHASPCPLAGSAPIVLPLTPANTPATVRVPVVAEPDGLCLLTRRDSSTLGRRASVARSYSGRDWERSPGLFAGAGSGASVTCGADPASGRAEGECDVVVPALPAGGGSEYVLESYSHGVGAEAEAARFLEQVSF